MKLTQSLRLIVMAGILVVSAWGQSTATLSGTVTDPTGAVLPDAQVTVHSLATGADRAIKTDGAGLYAVPSLQPGDYQVQATASGFATYTVQKVTLDVDKSITVNMKLSVSSAGATVEVESDASQIESQTMTVGQVIDRQTVQEIPLNGRHFLDLTVLTPGGVVAPTAGSLTGTSRGLGANSFITAGNREDSVNFQINGVNLNDMAQNQITFQPSINTTSEFKIDNSTFSAEYGRSSGSIVNVSTRSGSNSFHGEVFDYFRNEALDARNYFNRPINATTGASLGVAGEKAPLKRNNFGAAVGGPIWREHAFFFASYEGLRQHQGLLQNSTVLSNAASTSVNAAGLTVYSPNQRAAVAATGKPAANALLAVIPLPNSGNNYVAFTPGPVQIDQYTGDVLLNFSPKDTLHGFYAFQTDVRTEPALQYSPLPGIPGFGDHRNAHRQVATLNETHVFSPAFVNEARLGANRVNIVFTPNFLVNPSSYGIGSTPSANPGNIGIPQITLTDIGLTFGGPALFPQGRADTFGIFSDAATYLRGRHTVKFGGEFRRFLSASFGNDPGTLTYATSLTTSTTSAADAQAKTQADQFEQDVAPTFSITPTQIVSRIYVNALGVFAQDNFKLTPSLTLEYGFRFEWNGTPTEGANRFVAFDPVAVTLTRVGTNGLNSIYKQNYNFEPRLGFAWDVFATGKTVVRGGYGYMADQPVSNAAAVLASNPLFTNAVTSVSYNTAAAPIPVASIYNSAIGIALTSINSQFHNAYIESFNFNIQQQMPWGIVASAGYYGSVGKHLRGRTNQNQPNSAGVRPFPTLSATSPIDPGKPTNVNIAEVNSLGSSNYNALWVTAVKDFHNGLQFNMNYNYSKSLDTNSLGSQGGYTYQDSTNPANNYGPSDFDTRNHYAANAIYALPFKGNRFVEGFSLSTIVQYQTGNPLTLTNTSTFTGVSGIIRPNLVGPIVTQKIQKPSTTNVTFIESTVCSATLLPPNCSFQNTTTSLGNMSRGMIFGPGFADIDLSGEKDTKILEGLSFKLRVDAFDLLNHPNFAQPSGSTTSATFGQISATRFAISDGGSSRQLQLSGKFIF